MTSAAAFCGGGWLWLQLPALATLSACARDAARRDDPFVNLTAEQGRAMRAFAARLIPSDDGTPGAEEAGAAWFVDAAVGGPLASMRDPVGALLTDLDTRARSAHGVAFADATSAQQDQLMTDTDPQLFFMGRMITVMGVFSDPSYGGGRDHVGLTLLGMEPAPAYQPPFGWYDERHAQGGVA